jgi:hypothetical protein
LDSKVLRLISRIDKARLPLENLRFSLIEGRTFR